MPNPDGSTPDNSQQGTQDNQDGQGQDGQQGQQDAQQQANQQAQQQIDWENEGNIYKKRYADSQGQIQPLVRTLSQFAEYDHTTKQWKPKTQAPIAPQGEDFDKMLEGYDPEFKKAVTGYTQREIQKAISDYEKRSNSVSEYNTKFAETRNRLKVEFGNEFELIKGGEFNVESPLYKLANEILQAKYTEFNPDGSFHKHTTPEAEYLATVEAYAIMSKRSKQAPPDKAKLNAINGKGSKAGGVKKKLTEEEYMALPNDEARDAYDLQQVG